MEFREPVRARPLIAHAEGADRAVAQDSVVDIDLNDEWRIVVCERRAGSNWMVCTYISERVVSDHASENVAKLLDDLRPLKAVADDGLHPYGRHHREDRAVHIVQDVAPLPTTTWLALLEECNPDPSDIVHGSLPAERGCSCLAGTTGLSRSPESASACPPPTP